MAHIIIDPNPWLFIRRIARLLLPLLLIFITGQSAFSEPHYLFPETSAWAYPEIIKLTASDLQAFDNFGSAVAVSQDTVIVGAPYEDGGPGDPLPISGAVYVFEKDLGGASQWEELTKLAADDAQEGDIFGNAVAIDGDTIVVGAVHENGGSGDPLQWAGAVYVFERNLGGQDNWGQAAKLTASDVDAFDYFGISVAVYGDTIAVGAPGEDGDLSKTNVGAVYMFERDLGGAGSWGEAVKLTASDAQPSDNFSQVSLFQDTLVVGAPGEWNEFGTTIGAAYVFERTGVKGLSWEETAVLQSDFPQTQDRFGYSVSIYADTIGVGAIGNWGQFVQEEGYAYIFERDLGGPGAWGVAAKHQAETPAPADFFGYSVSLDGDTLLIGGPLINCAPEFECGATYVFNRDANGPETWGRTGILTASDLQGQDNFGNSVSVSGATLLIGSNLEDGGPGDPVENVGAAYVFYHVVYTQSIYLPAISKP